jgi:hypothetical protein
MRADAILLGFIEPGRARRESPASDPEPETAEMRELGLGSSDKRSSRFALLLRESREAKN